VITVEIYSRSNTNMIKLIEKSESSEVLH